MKKEKDSDRVLEGAVFALCVKDDITGADGKVILKADTVIEELATDKEGKLTLRQIYRLVLRIISKKHLRHLDLQ